MKAQLNTLNGFKIFEPIKDELNNFDNIELKKHKSESRKEPDLDANLSPDYYKNLEIRKSEHVPLDLAAIDEDGDEQELTVDIDRKKLLAADKEFGVMTRKDRAATFKPYNYAKKNGFDEDDVHKSNKQIDKELLDNIKQTILKNDEEEQQSSEQDHNDISEEELEKRVIESFIKGEKEHIGVASQPKQSDKARHQFFIEEENSDAGNVSQSSKSKYSIPDSEMHDNMFEKISTRPNDIVDPIHKPSVDTERVNRNGHNSHLSIGRMQYGISRFQNAGKELNIANNISSLNVSQQARNMMAKEISSLEAGNRRNSPYSVNFSQPFQTVFGEPSADSSYGMNANTGKRISNLTSNSVISDNNPLGINMNQFMSPYFGTAMNPTDQNASGMNLGSMNMQNITPENMNQYMNPFMMQMMIMQQNAQLIAQQQELIKSVGHMSQDNSKNRKDSSISRGRPYAEDELPTRFNTARRVENKSHIGNAYFSELNDDSEHNEHDPEYDPENIRAASVSIERKRNVNNINQTMQTVQKFKAKTVKPASYVKADYEPKIYDKTLAIPMQDEACKINPNLKLREGDIVTVERYIPELDLYQCRNDNNVGMYSKESIKIVQKKGQKEHMRTQDKSVERRIDSLDKEILMNTKSKNLQYLIFIRHYHSNNIYVLLTIL